LHVILKKFVWRVQNNFFLKNTQEIDPSGGVGELPDDLGNGEDLLSVGKAMLQEMLGSFPGVDEAVSFSEVMKFDFFFKKQFTKIDRFSFQFFYQGLCQV
jgi:hypothetical protein